MATPADAEIALKLYDLRREETMRKARNYIGMEFWPTTVEEFKQIHVMTNPNNVYWRQVISYWEMAAGLALHGGIDADLFADTQGEAFFIRAKFAELSEQATGNVFMPKTKKLIDSNETAKAVFAGTEKNIAARRAKMASEKQ